MAIIAPSARVEPLPKPRINLTDRVLLPLLIHAIGALAMIVGWLCETYRRMRGRT
jgi:hypothetical protein